MNQIKQYKLKIKMILRKNCCFLSFFYGYFSDYMAITGVN